MKKNACIGQSIVTFGQWGTRGTYEVVGVPESFEALLSDRRMGSGVHQEHDQEHPGSQYNAGEYRLENEVAWAWEACLIPSE